MSTWSTQSLTGLINHLVLHTSGGVIVRDGYLATAVRIMRAILAALDRSSPVPFDQRPDSQDQRGEHSPFRVYRPSIPSVCFDDFGITSPRGPTRYQSYSSARCSGFHINGSPFRKPVQENVDHVTVPTSVDTSSSYPYAAKAS